MKTNEDLMSELIHKAEASAHRQFQYLRNYKEYFRARQVKRTHILLVKSLKQSANKQFKNYCRAVAIGKTDVIKLLAYCATIKVLSFYEEELRIIINMIIEYECYLASGNLLDFIFGLQRPDDKLWDHRGL